MAEPAQPVASLRGRPRGRARPVRQPGDRAADRRGAGPRAGQGHRRRQAEGQVAIVTATLTAANQNAWVGHMKARLAERWPRLELVAVKPSNEDQKQAFQVTQDLLRVHPGLKGVFGISSVAFPGAAEAVKQAGRSGEVHVTGLSTPNAMKPFVHDGWCCGTPATWAT